MIPAPSDLLGLEGFVDPAHHTAWLRYVLLGIIGLWVASLSRGLLRVALALGILCAESAILFWIFAFQRPYGVLVEADATRRAAEIAVASFSATGESFLVGEDAGASVWRWLVGAGVPVGLVQLLPTLLPLLVLPGLALAVASLWKVRDRALFGASLLLIGSTGPLDVARGFGFLPGIWSQPEAAIGVLIVSVAVLSALRAPLSGRMRTVLGLSAVALALGIPRGSLEFGVADTVLALTLDQTVWGLLAALGLFRGWDGAARVLISGGGLVALASSLGAPVDLWSALVLYRVGLVLAASDAIWSQAPRIGAVLARIPPLGGGFAAHGLGCAAVLLMIAPGSFLVWWNPPRIDVVAAASLHPPSVSLEPSMAWIRTNTRRDAVFLASPAYASSIAVRAGRRVLRAPDLVTSHDETRRVRLERLLLTGRAWPDWADTYGVGWIYAAPGDFKARGVESPEALALRPGLLSRYQDARRFHVLEVDRGR